jgi:transcriptional regulator with XRE-family HTH domain
MIKDLGKRIRELRKSKKITLVEMAEKTGVAQATLSRIETGTMTGTVESHERISEVLGIGLAELYTGVDRRYSEVGHQQKKDIQVQKHSTGYKIELLTQESSKKKITPLLVTIQPNEALPSEKNERGVEKFIYVLSGSLVAKIEKKEYFLHPEESLYFDASLDHELRNQTNSPTKLMVVVSPSKI